MLASMPTILLKKKNEEPPGLDKCYKWGGNELAEIPRESGVLDPTLVLLKTLVLVLSIPDNYYQEAALTF